MKSKYIKPVVFSALCLSMGFSARGGITAGNKDNPLTPFNKGDNEEIVFTFGDKEVRKAEFVSVYEKNNTISGHFDEKSLKEYLELYIKFKLKVQQAKDMQLDTLSSIHAEFTKYRKQISKSYLSDKQFKDKLIEKVYEKLKTEIKASHIMIKLAANTSDEDSLSLAAYNKIMDARNRILKGEDFGEVALEVSQDPSAKTNKGNLGYFSAFEMVYDFEEAAYHTKVGAISMPVRTGFGYHILKVEDKRPSRGKILTAHIFVKLNQKATEEEQNKAKQRIDDYYKKIKSGTSTFEAIVIESSDDQVSVKKGGELYWIGVTSWRRRMLPAFEDAAFSLKNNDDISEPVQTRFGWHIIKRIDKKDLSPLEEIRKELGGKIDKDAERSKTIRKAFIENVKKEYNFTQFAKPKEKLLATIDESILKGEWQAAKPSKLKKTLFTLLDKKYTQLNFARFIEKRQPKKSKAPIKNIFNDLYQQFIDKSCIDFEESRLEIKYPEFKTLMDEYKEGILLFELMDRKVWSKAVEDTTGIKEFFKTHIPIRYTCGKKDWELLSINVLMKMFIRKYVAFY